MPALPPEVTVQAIEEAFTDSAASAVLVSEPRGNPKRFYVTSGEASFSVWIYVWTLTHGGGAVRPVDEYRIQLTSVTPPLSENPDGLTLLLGYEPDTKCFAGFDPGKHRTFSTQSPSIQININTLREAARDGFAFVRKSNDEIAVGFRPDNMLAYCSNYESLHKNGADVIVSNLLSRIGRLESVMDDELSKLTDDRRRIVTKLSHLVRCSNFRRKVTVAYDRKCCVTGMQLRLIDAAHVLPVGAKGSADDVFKTDCVFLPLITGRMTAN